MPELEIYQRLGANLRALRKMRGWTQEDLAARAQLNRSYLCGVERGNMMRNPSLKAMDRMAKALGVSILELLR